MKATFTYLVLPLVGIWVSAKAVIWIVQKDPIPFCWLMLAILLCGLILSYQSKKKMDQRGWRIGQEGRDEIYYEEKVDGEWKRIMIHAEMLTGKFHRVIDLSSIRFPAWAVHREDEIIHRIKSAFPSSNNEYIHHTKHAHDGKN